MCLLWTEERRSLGCFCLFAVLHTAVVYFIFRLFFVCSFRFVFIIAADVCDCEHVSVRMCSSTRMPCTRDPYILYHVCAFRLFYIPVALYIFFFCSFVSSYERSAALLFHLCCSSIGICRPSCSYYIVLCVHAHAASSPLLCAGWTCAYGMHACMHVSVCCMLLLFASWALCMNAFRCICYARAYNDKDQKPTVLQVHHLVHVCMHR